MIVFSQSLERLYLVYINRINAITACIHKFVVVGSSTHTKPPRDFAIMAPNNMQSDMV